MYKRVYKIIVLTAVFIAALIFMSENIKEEEINLTSAVKMEDASFPLLYIESGGYVINRLHGYSGNIEANVIRESMTPIDNDKTLQVRIQENESIVKKIKYEIRELKNNILLDSGSISALDEIENGKSAKIKFEANFVTGKEYAAKITVVTNNSKKINYYTRVKYYETDYYLAQKMDFINNFHESSLDKQKAQALAKYLETDGTEDGSSFAKVTIHSSFDMFSWGNLNPTVITDIVPTIKEFNVETAAVQLEYFVSAKTDSGKEIYSVKEFYRIRYTADRIYLLNYERTMESMFDINLASLGKGEFKIGVTNDKDIDIVTSGENGKVAFVRNGELWYYSLAENEAVRVFSFMSDKNDYIREGYDQHNIRILNMDDSGNIDFTVYGYMNRGDYEGKVALIFYRFYIETKQIEEKVCIPLETSYQILKEDIEGFSYANHKDVFYFTLNNTIYSYDINAREVSTIATNITEKNFAAMPGKHAIAWLEGKSGEEAMIIYDLEKGTKKKVKAPQGEIIKILGSLDNHVLYGYVKKADIKEMKDGTVLVPAYKLEIADNDGTVLKEYRQKGVYITDAKIKDTVAQLIRMKKSKDGYKVISSDSILSQGKEDNNIIGLRSRVTDLTKTEWYLFMPEGFAMKNVPKVYDTMNAVLKQDTTLHLDKEEIVGEKYYIQAYGSIIGSTDDVSEAIAMADENVGVVIDGKHQLVWERSGKYNHKMLNQLKEVKVTESIDSVAACLSMMLQYNHISADINELTDNGKSIYDVLKKHFESPINLTGCNLEEILYFVSGDRPVIAMKDNTHAVLVIGYDETSVTIFDPQSGKKKFSLSAGTKLFEEAGNVFLSYCN